MAILDLFINPDIKCYNIGNNSKDINMAKSEKKEEPMTLFVY